MSAVTNSTIVGQSVLNTKSILDAQVGIGITDPSSLKRSSKQPFIRTNRARKSPYFPVVVIEAWTGPLSLLSKQGVQLKVPIQIQIMYFAKNQKHPDTGISEILEVMRTEKTTFDGYGMRRANPYSSGVSPLLTDVDNVHSKAATYNFVYYAN